SAASGRVVRAGAAQAEGEAKSLTDFGPRHSPVGRTSLAAVRLQPARLPLSTPGSTYEACPRRRGAIASDDFKPRSTLPSFPRKRESRASDEPSALDSRFRGNDGGKSCAPFSLR